MLKRFVKNPRRLLIWFASIVAAYTVVGFLLLPLIIKPVAIGKLSEALDREVLIEAVRINPYSLTFTVRGFDVKKRASADSFLSFDELFINLQARSILNKGVTVKELRLTKPYVGVERIDDETYNFSDLVSREKPEIAKEEVSGEEEEKRGAPFSINNIQIIDGSADFHDRPKDTTHRVRELTVNIPFISSLAPEVDIFVQPAFSAKINDTLFDLGGTSKPFADTHQTTLEINLSDLSIPYYASYSPVPLGFDLLSGGLSVDLDLSYIQGGEGVEGARVLNLSGIIKLTDLAIDDLKGEPMVRLPLFSIDIASAELFREKVRVSEVLIEGLSLDGVRGKDGVVNFTSFIPSGAKKEGKAVRKTGKKGPPLSVDIKVETVRLLGAEIKFVDKSLPQTYSTKLSKINAEIKGLSSTEGERAEVSLSAILDGYAPFEIKGKVAPLSKDLFVDLGIDFKDFSLSSISPYTGKYIGSNIEKGKLFLSLEYLIEERKLSARNDLFIDNITLGEKVESEDATSLPVGLALSLLKDRDGRIDLKVPVSGSLDDPEFSVFSIAIRLFVNIIVKAATAPFAVLGAIVGGGEELSYVEFNPGAFLIMEAELKKLEKLATALYERPNIKIEIEGFVDKAADSEVLREEKFLVSLKAQKFKRVKGRKDAPQTVDEVEIPSKDLETYLWLAYKKTEFEKEKNAIGLTKKIEPAEMKRLMLEHIEVSEDELRELSKTRSEAVKNVLLASEKVEAERIFILWPDELTPEAKEGVSEARVVFRLK